MILVCTAYGFASTSKYGACRFRSDAAELCFMNVIMCYSCSMDLCSLLCISCCSAVSAELLVAHAAGLEDAGEELVDAVDVQRLHPALLDGYVWLCLLFVLCLF